MLLLGGSAIDNLFQIPGIEEHLDLLASVGGNGAWLGTASKCVDCRRYGGLAGIDGLESGH